MTKKYYEQIINKELLYNTVYSDLSSVNTDTIATNLIEDETVLNINFVEDNVKTFDIMINSLNKIVYVILAASCLLAFVVLYNLTNINIMERIREIATLKVLGFYDKEVSSYIFRETLILTFIGIFGGLFLGVFLHGFVMQTAEMDFIMFLKDINPLSHLYASVITILFTVIVALATHQYLKKVNMVESLKSVE